MPAARRWAAKIVMTAEQINPKGAVIHQTDRAWLKENLSPPVGWHVWIGTYSGDLGIFQHPGKLEVPAINDATPAHHNLELTMIGIGKLMFLVINSSWQRIWDIVERLGTPSGLCRIWPIDEQISWPRWTILTDAEAEYFTTYLARILNQHV
jgi:hypothetical protein